MIDSYQMPGRYIEELDDLLAVLQPQQHQITDNLGILGFAVDSRKVQSGDVFVAIPGAKVDGHDYIDEARQRGAIACLIASPEKVSDLSGCVVVPDTVVALGQLAAAHRRSLGTKIIALTGSVGKTTTKDMLHAIMSSVRTTRKSQGNFNSTIGLPLQLLKIKPRDEWFIAEMGMSTPGEIARLMKITQPDMALWLNVRAVHLANFEDLESISQAKAEMVENLNPGAMLVYNADDPLVTVHCTAFKGNKMTYSFRDPEADVLAWIEPLSNWDSTNFKLSLKGGTSQELSLPLPGRYNVANAVAAGTVAIAAGLAPSDLVSPLRAISLSDKRSRMIELAEDTILIDDTYNANPHAVDQVLRSFATLAEGHYRWLILGDMLELGESEVNIHRELGRRLAGYGFDRITLVGPLCEHLYQEIFRTNPEARGIEHFSNADSAVAAVNDDVPCNARIWCKASRGIGLEVVAQAVADQLRAREG